jgi:hypothetical protein
MERDRIAELRAVQDMAIDHAIEEMQAAHELGLESKTSRGDRGWLTGMAAKSIGVACKIEQFVVLRSTGNGGNDPDAEDAATVALIQKANAEVARILEGSKAGPTERPKRGKRTAA